jgi:hypothetical protein
VPAEEIEQSKITISTSRFKFAEFDKLPSEKEEKFCGGNILFLPGNLSTKNRLVDRFFDSGAQNLDSFFWTGFFQSRVSDRKVEQD